MKGDHTVKTSRPDSMINPGKNLKDAFDARMPRGCEFNPKKLNMDNITLSDPFRLAKSLCPDLECTRITGCESPLDTVSSGLQQDFEAAQESVRAFFAELDKQGRQLVRDKLVAPQQEVVRLFTESLNKCNEHSRRLGETLSRAIAHSAKELLEVTGRSLARKESGHA